MALVMFVSKFRFADCFAVINTMTPEKIFKKIIALDTLTPSDKVNALFTSLVNYVTDFSNHSRQKTLSKAKIAKLQNICSKAEYEMEVYWAKRIISGEYELKDFPYYQNYVELTRVEWAALKSCHDHAHHNVLFVGSGPLPMTAIILATLHNTSVTLVDSDLEAVRLSKKVINTLGLGQQIKIMHGDAAGFKKYHNFNTIFIAALVGDSAKGKIEIFDSIKENLADHTHIITRSSWGKRKLLYQPLPKKVYSMFSPILEIVPYNKIVNSVVIFKYEKNDHE